jgi:ABC-type Zn uptake system ZnuABC Zn-binding protein ZnuA
VVTTPHLADLAREIGGKAVVVKCLLEATPEKEDKPEETEEKEKKPKDQRATLEEIQAKLRVPLPWKTTAQQRFHCQSSAVLVLNGFGLESDLDEARLAEWENAGVTIGVVQKNTPESDLLRRADGTLDPCYWNSPSLLKHAVRTISQALQQRLASLGAPEAAPFISAREQSLLMKVGEAQKWLQTRMAAFPPDQRCLLSSHDSIGYFCREFQIEHRSLYLADGTPHPQAKEHIQWAQQRGVKHLLADATLKSEAQATLSAEHFLATHKERCYSLTLAPPGTTDTGGAEHLPLDTTLGVLRHIGRVAVKIFPQKASSAADAVQTP